jgi:hypothetical protein
MAIIPSPSESYSFRVSLIFLRYWSAYARRSFLIAGAWGFTCEGFKWADGSLCIEVFGSYFLGYIEA